MPSPIDSFTRKLTAASLTMAALILTISASSAATYYSDPAGKMDNNGTSPATPWASLETIFAATPPKAFTAGDVIIAKAGYHGPLSISTASAHTGNVTIQAEAKTKTMLASLAVDSPDWTIDGFDICGENAGDKQYLKGSTVNLTHAAANVTVKNCLIRGAKSIAGWTAAEWTAVPKTTAVSSSATHTTFSDNTIQYVRFGFCFEKSATFGTFSHNTIREFHDDGMRGLADDCLFEYNTVMNSYVRDANHDDLFQSWSIGTGPDGKNKSGGGTIHRLTLRGNKLIAHTDASQPDIDQPQGMGLFDGMFDGWVIENNVISVSNTRWGIGLLGATNCTIINNTVVENAACPAVHPRPGIDILEHKTNNKKKPGEAAGTMPMSSGNVIRNNISTVNFSPLPSTTADHNLPATGILGPAEYEAYFVDYAHEDFHLKKGSPAIGAGSSVGAPKLDADGKPRTEPYSAGAYQFDNEAE